MSSVIEGYNYDIFISYRQKDNKGDRWVSEFVEALRTELESTIKEEISLYFDINPHDGLLETHDVDESLKDKLKCLIFIPVISRTYCDPKSFAWQHEFISFIEQASKDRFGLKVKLPHGNVATRVLPVKIHELDPADQVLCENVLKGVPRGVDFIYKSTGVNRPLRMNEDNPRDNLNHTYYRDQINKVANAIDEIISGLKYPLPDNVKEKMRSPETGGSDVSKKSFFQGLKLKVSLILAFLTCLGLIGYFFFHTSTNRDNKLSLAFIPFKTSSGDYKLLNAENNFIEAVRGKLSKIPELQVIPRISTLQYRETDLSLRKIRHQLKADFIIGGRVWNEEGQVKIFVELSESEHGNVLWQEDYSWDNENSVTLTNEVTGIVTSCLNVRLTPEESQTVFAELTDNAEANMNYLSAYAQTIDNRFYGLYDYDRDTSGFINAIKSYDRAIELDPHFGDAYIGRSMAASWGVFLKQLDTSYIRKSREDLEKAASLNNNINELSLARGFYFYYCAEKLDSALKYFTKASHENPYDYQPLFYIAMVYRRNGKWNPAKSLLAKVARYNPREALLLTNIGMTHHYLHEYDSALIFHQKAIELNPHWKAAYINKTETLTGKTGKTKEAWRLINSALVNTGDSLIKQRVMLLILDKRFKEALELARKTNPDRRYPEYERLLDIAGIYSFMNNKEESRANYDSAKTCILKYVSDNPDDYFFHSKLSIALAGGSEFAEALEEAELAVKLSVKNGLDYKDMMLNLAQIYIMTGDYGRGIDVIESLLSGPSLLSVELLLNNPLWAPLQNMPDFKEIIHKYIGKA